MQMHISFQVWLHRAGSCRVLNSAHEDTIPLLSAALELSKLEMLQRLQPLPSARERAQCERLNIPGRVHVSRSEAARCCPWVVLPRWPILRGQQPGCPLPLPPSPGVRSIRSAGSSGTRERPGPVEETVGCRFVRLKCASMSEGLCNSAHLVHVAPEELVVAFEALHKAFGRDDTSPLLLRIDLQPSRAAKLLHSFLEHSKSVAQCSIPAQRALPSMSAGCRLL